jgi:DNA-binding IclR family transcriptional regulator
MSDRPIRALERTLGTLRQLSRDGMQTLEQLTVATGYPRSSLLRLLRSLEAVGAVVRDPVDRRYHARLRVVPLAEGDEALRRRTYLAVRDLVATCGQTVELYTVVRGQLIMLERHEPETAVPPVGARIGHPRPRDEIDAVVQVALVSGDEDVSLPRRPYFLDGGEKRSLTPAALDEALAQVRTDGVASDLAVNGFGVRRHAIALPHLDGRLAGALVVAQTDQSHSREAIRQALLAWRAKLAVTQE